MKYSLQARRRGWGTDLWQASLFVQWAGVRCHMLRAHRDALHSKALQTTANLHHANMTERMRLRSVVVGSVCFKSLTTLAQCIRA